MKGIHPQIPPLVSGGIMLTYRCTNACRHCLYRCSPAHEAVFMSAETMERVFAALEREPSFQGVHLAGGEATLNMDCLLAALQAAARHGIPVDYLETNANWCATEAMAVECFDRMRAEGLRAVLISASLFHLEYTPLEYTLNAIAAAEEVFGGNVIVWTRELLNLMVAHFDPTRKYSLAESCRILGLDPDGADMWNLHSYLTPGGRAVETLGKKIPRQPLESFEGDSCGRTLSQTGHFHITPEGYLFTGLCGGISVADTQDFHPAIDRQKYPLYHMLWAKGPLALLDEAKAAGFTPNPAGYLGKCHLCLELRKALVKSGTHSELRPAAYYR